MHPVVQEEVSGCGIAACAALAGLSYADARRTANRIGIHAEDPTLWSDSAHVRTLLSTLGISTAQEETPFVSWQSLPDKALLAIKWHLEGGKPFWHWVVFVRQGEDTFVLDSKKGLKSPVRRDFGRMKPKWYLEVPTG